MNELVEYTLAMREPDGPTEQAAYERMLRHEAKVLKQKDQSDRAMFWVALCSTFVAVIAALGALWSGYEAHKTRTEDERPFIAVEPNFHNQDSRGRAVVLSAFGKSPAMKISASCKSLLSVGETWNWLKVKSNANQEYIPYILPGRKENMLCPLEQPATNGFWVVLGIISYSDQTGHGYQTPFCFVGDKHFGADESYTGAVLCPDDRHAMPTLE